MTRNPFRHAAALATTLAALLCNACGPDDGAAADAAALDQAAASGGATALSLQLSTPTVAAGGTFTATVTLGGAARASGAGGVVVYLGFSRAALAGPRFVRVPAGQSSATVMFHASPFLAATTATALTANTAIPQPWSFVSRTVTIVPAAAPPAARAQVAAVAVRPEAVVSGQDAVGTLTLTAPAPAGGVAIQVNVSGDLFARDAEPPSTVVVPEGATSADFTVRTHLASPIASWARVFVVASCFGGPFQGAPLVVAR